MHWLRMIYMYTLGTGLWINMARYALCLFFNTWFNSSLQACLDGQKLCYWCPDLPQPQSHWPHQDCFLQWSNQLWIQVQATLCVIASRTQITWADNSYCCPWCHSSKYSLFIVVWIITNLGAINDTSSLQHSMNGVKARWARWALTARRARLRNLKAIISRRCTITTWKLWWSWRRKSTHTTSSCQSFIQKSCK